MDKEEIEAFLQGTLGLNMLNGTSLHQVCSILETRGRTIRMMFKEEELVRDKRYQSVLYIRNSDDVSGVITSFVAECSDRVMLVPLDSPEDIAFEE